MKEPIFIRTLRLKFNILNPLNKNFSEADTGGGSYITGFMSSAFIRMTFGSEFVNGTKDYQIFNNNSKLKIFSRNSQKSSDFLCRKQY